MRINVGNISPEHLIKYLQKVLNSDHPPFVVTGAVVHFAYHAWDDPTVKEAFHRLSTCIDGCECSGYNPKKDCPDMECYCNK